MMKQNTMTYGVFAGVLVLVATTMFAVAQTPSRSTARARHTKLTPEALQRLQTEKEYRLQGDSYMQAGNPQKAEEWFRKAIDVYKGSVYSPQAHCGLADALLAQGQRNEAITLYQEALRRVGSGSPEFLLRYGRVCERAQLPKEAALAYRRAFSLQESFPISLTGKESDAEVMLIAEASRGIYQHGKGDLTAAIATYKKVLAQNPDFTVIRKKLAGALEEKGQLKEARQERAILAR